MKNLFLILFIFCFSLAAKNANAQAAATGECTIHIFLKGQVGQVYVHDSLIMGMNKDEALEYKMTAKGRESFSIKLDDIYGTSLTVDTKKQPHYYIIVYKTLYPMPGARNKIVDAAEWKKESKNFKELIKINANAKTE